MNWTSHLDLLPEHRFVLSVVAVRIDEEWHLLHGSALFVSTECASSSWGVWRHDPNTNDPDRLPSEFWLAKGDWAMGRAVVDQSAGITWLDDLHTAWEVDEGNEGLASPALANIPPLHMQLREPAGALSRIFLHTDTPSTLLALSAGRALRGILLRSDIDAAFDEPSVFEHDGWWTTAPGMDLVGMGLWGGSAAVPLPRGLLIGATDERLWIWEMRTEDGYQRVHLDFAWNPSRIELADLSITHEQFLGDDLVSTATTRVAEIENIRSHTGSEIRLSFESIGRRSKHEFVVRDSSGDVLDRIGPYGFVEQVGVTINFGNGAQSEIKVGEPSVPTPFQDRAKRQAEIAQADRDFLHRAVSDRVIADRQDALNRLVEEINRSTGELLIIDPYFGSDDITEWRLLDGVQVPVRVVSKKIAVQSQPGPNVLARRYSGADMHDRAYFWDTGGVSVGGSPSTFGKAPIRFSRIDANEITRLKAQFEDYWSDAAFTDFLPQSPAAP